MLFSPARTNMGFDLFDDFFDDSFFHSPVRRYDAPSMKTDIKDDGKNYMLDIELPGFKKEDIKAELKDGYLTISAIRESKKDEKDANGKLIRQERYSGSCKRSFYVGEELKQEDIHASFEDGILKMQFPKEAPKEIEETPKYIAING